MQGPVPDQFSLVVTDMGATVAFYRQLGLTIPDADPHWQRHHRTPSFLGSAVICAVCGHAAKAPWCARSATFSVILVRTTWICRMTAFLNAL